MSDNGVMTTPIFDELAREIGIEIDAGFGAGIAEPAGKPAQRVDGEVRKAG